MKSITTPDEAAIAAFLSEPSGETMVARYPATRIDTPAIGTFFEPRVRAMVIKKEDSGIVRRQNLLDRLHPDLRDTLAHR